MGDAEGEANERPVEWVVASPKVSNDDACLRWLQHNHRRLAVADGGRQKKGSAAAVSAVGLWALENDVRACDSLRWSRFSFPSEPHNPLRSTYNSETSNPTPVRVAVVDAHEGQEGHRGPVQVVLDSAPKGSGSRRTGSGRAKGEEGGARSAAATFDVAPARSIFREVVLQRDLERQLGHRPTWKAPGGPQEAPIRPFLGGYVAAPTPSDAFRFLVFPQRRHSLFPEAGPITAAGPSPDVTRRRAETPQEVPCYVRGRVDLKLSDVKDIVEPLAQPASAPASPLASRVRDAVRVSVFGSRKFPFRPSPVGEGDGEEGGPPNAPFWARPRRPAAVDVEAYSGHRRSERRYAAASGKVEKRTLAEDGLRVAVYGADPRYSTAVTAAHATVENSFRRYSGHKTKKGAPHAAPTERGNDTIVGFTVEDAYDSAVQSLHPSSLLPGAATYRVQWRAGPGVEHCSSDQRSTVFAKLSSESWVEWTITVLKRPLNVKLRNQSSLLQPLEFASTSADAHRGDEADPVGEAAPSATHGTAHEYLWATQGPKWDPKLLRGFEDDYSNLHHCSSWYSAFSLEFSRKAKSRKGDAGGGGNDAPDSEGDSQSSSTALSGFFHNTGMQAFANACFVDSFREYPRASLGFSLTSNVPRVTVDAFNKFLPKKLECSFSWYVSFKERQLLTGLQHPELPEHQQYMRLSPVETFRHVRCGLTWTF